MFFFYLKDPFIIEWTKNLDCFVRICRQIIKLNLPKNHKVNSVQEA